MANSAHIYMPCNFVSVHVHLNVAEKNSICATLLFQCYRTPAVHTSTMFRVDQNHIPYVYGVCTVFLAGKSPIFGQIGCVYTVVANPSYVRPHLACSYWHSSTTQTSSRTKKVLWTTQMEGCGEWSVRSLQSDWHRSKYLAFHAPKIWCYKEEGCASFKQQHWCWDPVTNYCY